MGDDTFRRIQAILVDLLEIEPSNVTLRSLFIDDFHVDSLEQLELIVAFEDAFDVMIPDTAVETIATVQDAVDCIEQHGKPRCP